MDGETVGLADGDKLGAGVGLRLGDTVGPIVGESDGLMLGAVVGLCDGLALGSLLGDTDGASVLTQTLIAEWKPNCSPFVTTSPLALVVPHMVPTTQSSSVSQSPSPSKHLHAGVQ